jgi:alginate O-acetyltransferase complex protein AlgI
VLFPTFTFAAFFAVVLPISWLLKSRPTPWKLFVLAASYWFYGSWDARFLLLLAGVTVVDEVFAVAIARSDDDGLRKRLVLAATALNLVVLGFFKYYGFFVDSFEDLTGLSGPALEVVLPVGVSFFTFQGMSYVIDVYRRDCPPAPLLDVAVYLAFFPQLVAGPIVRGTEFLPQLRDLRPIEEIPFTHAAVLIGRGLFKKVVISSFLAGAIVDDVFATPGSFSGLETLVGVYGYAVQIYADFSGYTDIAIGVALLMGFQFPQNFDRPYAAVSVQDFWRRWHMTLSRWLRDYLYLPLGGNRKGPNKTYRNLFLTMTLGGLWHGAAWTFVIWGVYQGIGLAGERAMSDLRGERDAPIGSNDVRLKELAELNRGTRLAPWRANPSSPTPFTPLRVRKLWLGRIITFHFVCLGWILFRAESFSGAVDVVERILFGGFGVAALDPLIIAAIVASIAVQYLPSELGTQWMAAASRVPLTVQAVVAAIWILLVVALGPEGVAPFIYFQF